MTAAAFRIDGAAVTSAVLNKDARSGQREVVLAVESLTPLRRYVLRVAGIRDRSPASNATKGQSVEFVAKPGVAMRSDFITRWCIVGPLPADRANVLAPPTAVRPSPGDRIGTAGQSWPWKLTDGPVIDLRGAYGDLSNVIACASVYLFSDRRREAVVHLDTNDHNRLWLNSRLVHDGITRATAARGFHDYTDSIPVTLQAGWNRVLVQVENRGGAWWLAGRLTDPAGQPLRDVTWQLEDPGREVGSDP